MFGLGSVIICVCSKTMEEAVQLANNECKYHREHQAHGFINIFRSQISLNQQKQRSRSCAIESSLIVIQFFWKDNSHNFHKDETGSPSAVVCLTDVFLQCLDRSGGLPESCSGSGYTVPSPYYTICLYDGHFVKLDNYSTESCIFGLTWLTDDKLHVNTRPITAFHWFASLMLNAGRTYLLFV